MNINGQIKNILQMAYQSGIQLGGKLQGHAIKLLKLGVEMARKDPVLAGLTLVVANFIICEITLQAAHPKFSPKVKYKGLGGTSMEISMKRMIIPIVMTVANVIVNFHLHRTFKLPLHPAALVAIPVFVSTGRILLRYVSA